MPSKPQRKQYVAARDFKHGRKVYRKGDPVTKLGTIDLLVKRGDRWITRAPKPDAAVTESLNDSVSEPPADEPQQTNPEEG